MQPVLIIPIRRSTKRKPNVWSAVNIHSVRLSNTKKPPIFSSSKQRSWTNSFGLIGQNATIARCCSIRTMLPGIRKSKSNLALCVRFTEIVSTSEERDHPDMKMPEYIPCPDRRTLQSHPSKVSLNRAGQVFPSE